MMAARDAIAVQIQGALEVRANGESDVWLKLLDPDRDGEVSVSREVLEDAIAFVIGGGPGEWIPDE